MKIRVRTKKHYYSTMEHVLLLRNYISCLHPVNQKSLIESFNHYFTTGEVPYDYGKLEAIHQILLNYSNR